jgi:hypothetical protein
MTAQRNVSMDEGRTTTTNFALLRFLKQNPGIETALDFVNHCRRVGGDTYFLARCEEMGLDPNELCTSRSTEITDWVWMDPEGFQYPPVLAAIG